MHFHPIWVTHQGTQPTSSSQKNNVHIFQIDERYYRMLRFVLNTEEISERCFDLTTLLLNLKISNYYAMMLRK